MKGIKDEYSRDMSSSIHWCWSSIHWGWSSIHWGCSSNFCCISNHWRYSYGWLDLVMSIR
ncbi:12278_t:CDS:2, partial [Gigaspora rosea]